MKLYAYLTLPHLFWGFASQIYTKEEYKYVTLNQAQNEAVTDMPDTNKDQEVIAASENSKNEHPEMELIFARKKEERTPRWN